MNFFIPTIRVITFFVIISSCNDPKSAQSLYSPSNSLDTLKIGYLEKDLLGKLIWPKSRIKKDDERKRTEKILMLFASENYYYVFFNTQKKPHFLSGDFWNLEMPIYLRNSFASLPIDQRLSRIDYRNGPFLSGFFNKHDSLIVVTADLRAAPLNQLRDVRVNYFSTTDTLFRLSNIVLGNQFAEILEDWKIDVKIDDNKNYEIVLMEATSQVSNAWYLDFPGYYSANSAATVLSVRNGKITRIQYIDLEYVDYVFRQQDIQTKDIHLQ